MSYDSWKTTDTRSANEHQDDCTCEHCHAFHIEENLVPFKADDGLNCCEYELTRWIRRGDWCPVEGHGAGDMLTDGQCGLCLKVPIKDHRIGCICSKCHVVHVAFRLYREQHHDPNYVCCVLEVKILESQGKWCHFHGEEHMKNGRCITCEKEAHRGAA